MAKKVKDEKYWGEFGKRMGKKFGGPKVQYHSCCSSGSTFALLILLIGIYWLAKDLGWVQQKVSIWALILIVVGFYWFLKSLFRKY